MMWGSWLKTNFQKLGLKNNRIFICSNVEKVESKYVSRKHIIDDMKDLIITIDGIESDYDSNFYISSIRWAR